MKYKYKLPVSKLGPVVCSENAIFVRFFAQQSVRRRCGIDLALTAPALAEISAMQNHCKAASPTIEEDIQHIFALSSL